LNRLGRKNDAVERSPVASWTAVVVNQRIDTSDEPGARPEPWLDLDTCSNVAVKILVNNSGIVQVRKPADSST